MNRLLKLLGIGTVLTGYGIATVFGGKEGNGKNNKNPEEQTPSNQITSPFPQVNAFPQTTQSNPYQQANPFQPTNPFPQPQFPQPSSFPQTTPPPSSSLAPAEKGQSVASQSDAAERLKAATERFIAVKEKIAAAERVSICDLPIEVRGEEAAKIILMHSDKEIATNDVVFAFCDFLFQYVDEKYILCKISQVLSQKLSDLP